MSSPAIEGWRSQVRLRARRWLDLLAPGAPAMRHSAARAALLAEVGARLRAAHGTGPTRRAITAALRQVWLDAAPRLDESDAFAARVRAAVETLRWHERRLGAPEAVLIDGWDAVLTAAELRPGLLTSEALPGALRNALDTDCAARVEPALRAAFLRAGPGGWLRRQGVTTADDALAAFWRTVEPALLRVMPPAEQPPRAARAFENLLAWDERLAALRARVAAARGEEAAQATAARFLEPRVMAAYAWLPADELVRLALACGRQIEVATLTCPERPAREPARDLPTSAPSPEARLLAAERWTRFFAGLSRAVAEGALPPGRAVFLWLAAGVGAGEAWRATGGAPERVGSANYLRNQALEALGRFVGADETPTRLANPGAPDPRSRALVGLLNLRAADPFVDAAAAVAPLPPALDDDGLLALLYVLNLGPEGAKLLPPGIAVEAPALLARALDGVRIDRQRRAAAQALLRVPAQEGDAPSEGDLLFVLATMIAGLPSEAARWLAEAPPGGDGLLDRWLAAEGPAHEVLADLRRLGRAGVPPLTEARKQRPVEREAQLRLHLRAAAGGADG